MAIVRGNASLVGRTFATIGAAAIEARLVAILDHVGAIWSRAGQAGTNATLALRGVGADLSVHARRATDCTAVDIAFSGVFGAIGAFHVDARIHLANERARTALYAVDTRRARTIAIANSTKTIGLRAERSLGDGLMCEDAISARVGGAFFCVVVRLISRHASNVESGVAFFYFAISIELRRQCRTGRSQSFAVAFAIGTFWLAAEIDGAVVFAIGSGRAFGHAAAAATGARSSTAVSPFSTCAGISATCG